MERRPKALFILDAEAKRLVYGDDEISAIESCVDVLHPSLDRFSVRDYPDLLAEADILFSGWGAPMLNEDFLVGAPNLQIVFYAAGAIESWATPCVFERGIRITTAIHANSIPVAEYALSTILFSLKHGWRLQRETLQARQFQERDDVPGNFRSIVGLISMGAIGRLVARMIKPFDLDVLVYDPFLSESDARLLGVRSVSLRTMFAEADAISIHAPELRETRGMITGELIDSMKRGATLINTARGSVIRQDELIEVLARRPDLQAVLDVCDPEPPQPHCPLFDLPNVVLTPHIAGSAGRECRRMGQFMVQELRRYCNDQPLKWEVTPPFRNSAVREPSVQVRTVPRHDLNMPADMLRG